MVHQTDSTQQLRSSYLRFYLNFVFRTASELLSTLSAVVSPLLSQGVLPLQRGGCVSEPTSPREGSRPCLLPPRSTSRSPFGTKVSQRDSSVSHEFPALALLTLLRLCRPLTCLIQFGSPPQFWRHRRPCTSPCRPRFAYVSPLSVASPFEGTAIRT